MESLLPTREGIVSKTNIQSACELREADVFKTLIVLIQYIKFDISYLMHHVTTILEVRRTVSRYAVP